MRLVSVTVFLSATACLALAGCGASYDEKRDYLREVAVRGAETHALIAASEGKPDEERCKAAKAGLIDDVPDDMNGGGESETWLKQVEAFFVDSCVSGKPKELPPLGPPATPAVSVSPSVSPLSPSAAVTP